MGQQSIFGSGDAYEQFMGRWSRRLAPLLLRFANVQNGDDVLDVGSGTGELTLALAEALPSSRVTGVERSETFVQFARSRSSNERLAFIVADAQSLELPDDSFDRALSLLVLNFIPNPAQAVGEMIRVTRGGGVVAAAVWDYGEGMEMLRAFWDEAVALDPDISTRDEGRMPLCRRGELAALWESQNLEAVEETPLSIDLNFTSFLDYWSPFLGGQGPAGGYVAGLTADARAALESRLRARVLGDRIDQPFTLRARAWAVKGVVTK